MSRLLARCGPPPQRAGPGPGSDRHPHSGSCSPQSNKTSQDSQCLRPLRLLVATVPAQQTALHQAAEARRAFPNSSWRGREAPPTIPWVDRRRQCLERPPGCCFELQVRSHLALPHAAKDRAALYSKSESCGRQLAAAKDPQGPKCPATYSPENTTRQTQLTCVRLVAAYDYGCAHRAEEMHPDVRIADDIQERCPICRAQGEAGMAPGRQACSLIWTA